MNGKNWTAAFAIKNSIVKFSMEYIHDAGRVVLYEDLQDIILNRFNAQLSYLERDNSEFNLISLFKELGRVFYVYDIDDYPYVSLTRNYYYINPRFTLALEDVTDPTKEAILACGGESTEDGGRHPRFLQEYRSAKCSLAILDVLNAVYKCVPKGKHKVLFQRILDKFDGLSHLAKAVVRHCGHCDTTVNLNRFLALFNFVFKLEKALLSVDFDLLDGLIKAYEMDLIWSFSGMCVISGVTSLTDIHQKVNYFIIRAKMKFMTEMSVEDIVDMFRNRYEHYYMPGDGSVQLMYSYNDVSVNRLLMFREVFSKYLRMKKKHKSLHYSKCHEIFMKIEPMLVNECQDQTSATLASMLFSAPDEFNFIEGFITLAPKNRQLRTECSLIPVEVPCSVQGKSFPSLSLDILEGDGLVQEVGVRSAILRFSVNSSLLIGFDRPQTIEISGFCHRTSCLYEQRTIPDFSRFFKVGDSVKFAFQLANAATVYFPHYCTVLCIISHPNNDYLNTYRLPPNYPSDSSEDSGDEYCELTEQL